MRRSQTTAEKRLWTWLRDRRFASFKFRRQHPVAGFILDFYCPELKLAIELDGSHHSTRWMSDYDTFRTTMLAKYGIEVLRIPNKFLMQDSHLVEQCIRVAIT